MRFVIVYSLFVVFSSLVSAADPATVLQGFEDGDLARIAARAEAVAAIRTRNPETDSYGADQIAAADSALLRAGGGGSGGLIAEIFQMDAQGLTAAASGATSDFRQGDEAKLADTFCKGAGACLNGAVELDDRTLTYSAQVSAVEPGPESGLPIAAIPGSMNAEFLN